MWRIVIAVVLLTHGIGHSLGLFPALGLAKTMRWTDHSWLLTNLFGESAARWFGVVLWLAAMFGFIGTALGFYGSSSRRSGAHLPLPQRSSPLRGLRSTGMRFLRSPTG